MKKFPVFYQGLRKSNEYGGSLKNKRFAIVEFDEDVNGSYERLCEIVDTLRKEFGYEIPFVDCGFCHAEVEDVEEFYQFRSDFREVSRQLNRIKRELNADKFNSNEVWWEFVNRRGYKAETYQAVKGQKRMNGERFCNSHPTGKYILVMAGHLSCCINGVIYDTWDCSSKCVYRSIRVA